MNSSEAFSISLDDLDAIICEEAPSVEIVFDCEDSDVELLDDDDDAALVDVELVDTAVVLGYVERSLSDRASEAPTLRLPAQPERISRAWLVLAVLAVVAVLVGFVFGLGLLSLGDMLALSGGRG